MIKWIGKKALSVARLSAAKNRYIFVYHDVSNTDAFQHHPLYSTTPEQFKRQIEGISRYVEWTTLDEVVNPENSKSNLASLTFDDGFYSVKEHAWPILRKLGIPFTVFINSQAAQEGKLSAAPEYPSLNPDGEKIYMDSEDIKEIFNQGITIGNHSKSHPILSDCSPEDLESEIVESKAWIEKTLEDDIRHFALPFGKKRHFNSQVIDKCLSSGHSKVYSNNPSHFDSSHLNHPENPIPRIAILQESVSEILFYINRSHFKKIDL